MEFQLNFLTMLLSLTELAEREGIVVNLQRSTMTTMGGRHRTLQGSHTGLVSSTDTAIKKNANKAIQKIAWYTASMSEISKMLTMRKNTFS